MATAFGVRPPGIPLANSSAPEARRKLAGGEAAGNLSPTSRAPEGRLTKADTIIKASPASLPGREKSFALCPGGCASRRHRLISAAPPGRELTFRSLPAVSSGAALVVLSDSTDFG